jgi:alpha-ketoglutarate-dependent taurine dioxygenase
LRETHSEATWEEVRAGLRRSYLLVFPAQDLDDDQHMDAVAHFGPIAWEGRLGPQQVMHVSNRRPDGILGSDAASFHIDYGFFPHPYEALSLYGLEIPDGGAETWFVNAVLAARTLPVELTHRVEHLSERPRGGGGGAPPPPPAKRSWAFGSSKPTPSFRCRPPRVRH